MTTCAEWKAKLSAAESAFGTLMLGGKVESIQDGEKRITYTKSTIGDLRTYIQWLQRKVDACNGVCGDRRVIHFLPVDR